MPTYCAMTQRKLKPGAYDDFRRAFVPEDEQAPPGWGPVYIVRNLDDEDEVVAFGFFDGTHDELRSSYDDLDYSGQQERIAPYVESVGVDAIFEVVEKLGD